VLPKLNCADQWKIRKKIIQCVHPASRIMDRHGRNSPEMSIDFYLASTRWVIIEYKVTANILTNPQNKAPQPTGCYY
jgi:hypothetical protein